MEVRGHLTEKCSGGRGKRREVQWKIEEKRDK